MITRKAESMRIRVERHVQFSNCAIKTKTNELSGEVFTSDDLFDVVYVENTKLIKRHME